MADRPDLRQIAVDIGEALADYDRDALLEMLTYVFKEYVVEGAPPVLVSQVDGLEALDGLNFAQLIEQLQARLDVPELEQFAVRDGQVLVRVGGVLTPINAQDRRPTPSPAAMPAAAPRASDGPTESATNAGAPRPTRDEAVLRGRGDLVGGQRGVVSAPPPRGGLSVNSRPQAGAAAPAAEPPAPAPEPPERPEDDKDAPGDDDASVRFSLLELD